MFYLTKCTNYLLYMSPYGRLLCPILFRLKGHKDQLLDPIKTANNMKKKQKKNSLIIIL